MAVHAVQCAARYEKDGSCELVQGGPMVVVDDDHPNLVNVDGFLLRVRDWSYRPDREYEYEGKTFFDGATIEAHLPMENGCLLYLCWPDLDTFGFVLGIQPTHPDSWISLYEEDDRITLNHEGCDGGSCDCCDHTLEDGNDESPTFMPWDGERIVALWKRLGGKPYIPHPAHNQRRNSPTCSPPPRPADAVEDAVKRGRTVTRAEYLQARS